MSPDDNLCHALTLGGGHRERMAGVGVVAILAW